MPLGRYKPVNTEELETSLHEIKARTKGLKVDCKSDGGNISVSVAHEDWERAQFNSGRIIGSVQRFLEEHEEPRALEGGTQGEEAGVHRVSFGINIREERVRQALLVAFQRVFPNH